MAETMQAVVCHGPMDYRLDEVPVPRPGPGEALVRVEAVGICGSDIKCYHGGAKFWGDDKREAWAESEVIPGHEFVGEIVELDADAAARWGVEVGDRVTAEAIVPCWTCRFCIRGEYHGCIPHNIFGYKRLTPGAMAPFMVFPAGSLVHKVSKKLPAAHAAFTEPLSCGLHAVERANIHFEDTVVVAGCGPIGLGMIAGAAAQFPARIIALDPHAEKRELAALCGADLTIDVRNEDVQGIIMDLTDGIGADVYLEAVGRPDAVIQGLNLLRKLGTYVAYGVFNEEASVDWTIIGDDKELDVLGAHMGPYCWPAAVRMLESERLPMDRIVTHQLPLEEFQQAFDLLSRRGSAIKVSLIPS